MISVKKIAYASTVFILIVYFIFVFILINLKFNRRKCTEIILNIERNGFALYLNKLEIYNFLNKEKLNPIGKNMLDIKTNIIEEILQKHKLIKKAKVYKTINSAIRIIIYQQIPILQIISDKNDYYVDRDGNIFSLPIGTSIYVPLATGIINTKYIKNVLYPLAIFLYENKFWNNQIEQIYVNNELEIELIPRVGNHRIILGGIENFKNKLDNLNFFYKKVLNAIGWNRYSIINLKYKNQIVCTKVN